MDVVWNLFDNTVIFFAMISFIFVWPIEINKDKLPYQLIMGIVLSVMAAFTMFNSVHVGNGLYIDARYAIPIITILFFGITPGSMVIVTIIIIRVFALGGAGAPIGVTYALIQGVVTILYKKWYYDKHADSTLKISLKLFVLALFLQTILLFLPLIFLPSDIAWPAIQNNWIYLLTIYPAVVFVFSMVVGFRNDYYVNMETGRIRDRYLKLTLQRSPAPMAIYDSNGNFIHINDAWVEQSGYQREEYSTMWEWFNLVLSSEDNLKYKQYDGIDEMVQSLSETDMNIKTKHNGIRIWNVERKEAGTLPDGTNIFVSVGIDITEQKEYEQELINLSYHDFLTGLPNRRYYDEVFSKSDFSDIDLYVIYGDMNNLKSLNDYYGHNRGDKAIIETSKVLQEVFDQNTDIFRFGGDEFLLIVRNLSYDTIIQKMDAVSKRMKDIRFGEIAIGITLGMSHYSSVSTLSNAIMNAESRMYEYKILESTSARSGTIDVILTMLFEKDKETERHSKRVQEICRIFAMDLELNTNDVSLLLRAGLLHDIGKIITPSSIISTAGKLTDEQYEIIKLHPTLGYRILSSKGYMKQIGDIVLAHHEHIDGNGYPNGLKGDDIPYFARILSIVDAFEAMTSDRPYRKKKSFEEAKQELIRCSGTQFDEALVKQFVSIIPELPEFEPLQ